MKKSKEVFLGDKILTNKNFKPEDHEGNLVEISEEGLSGIVIEKIGKRFGIDFEKEYPFTHFLEGCLDKATYYYLNDRDFKVEETYENSDVKKASFVKLLKEENVKRSVEAPGELKKKERNIKSVKTGIRSREIELNEMETNLTKGLQDLTELRRDVKAISTNTSSIEKQYDKLLNNPKVLELDILEKDDNKYLLITTNTLTFSDENRDVPTFELGAYKILIPMESNGDGDNRNNIKIINYKKQAQQGAYHHPCINREMYPCFGNVFGNEIKRYHKQHLLLQIVYSLIEFLEKPNYDEPHFHATNFSCAQKVTIRPRDPFKWFDKNYWKENEIWDGDKYTKELKEKEDKYTGRRTTPRDEEEEDRMEEPPMAGSIDLYNEDEDPEGDD